MVTPITIDIDKLLKDVAVVAIIFVISITVVYIGDGLYNSGYDRGASSVVIPTPQPTTMPTITQTPIQTITFTVLTTSSNGNYEVTTTSGQILYCNNYYSWSQCLPRNTYTATINGNIISDIVLINSNRYYSPDYTDYYDRTNNHYQERYDVSRGRYEYNYNDFKQPSDHNVIIKPDNVILV